MNEDTILLISLLKATTEHSTYLIGTLKQKPKHDFNVCIKNIDTLIESLEKSLNEAEKEMLQETTDCIHDLVKEVRQQTQIK